jgi:archaemetzincin
MDPPTVTIVSFAHFGKEFLEKIAAGVEHELLCQVEMKEKHLDLSEYFDPGRRQYNGDKLLKVIDSMDFEGSVKIIALFNVDLYIPILTYIFGQAQLGGRTAIASLYRLSNERYGIANDEITLLDRFQKEVIHELGHLFGLIHCHTPTCVMRSSTYVEDIDQKDVHLCEKCRLELRISL